VNVHFQGSSSSFPVIRVDWGDEKAPTVSPIMVGGTGCFAGTSGYVELIDFLFLKDPNGIIFKTAIHIQEGTPDDCPSGEEMEMALFEENTSSDGIEGNRTLHGGAHLLVWLPPPHQRWFSSGDYLWILHYHRKRKTCVRYMYHYTSEFGEGLLSGLLFAVLLLLRH
jgi:hypothetical protein